MDVAPGFRSILVPLDFSEHSDAVLVAAKRILHAEGRAVLLHVVEWMPAVTEGTLGVYAHRKDIDDLARRSREKLEEYARKHGDRRFAIDVQEGKAASAILDAAQALRPEVIVMGAHGRSRLDHLLLGSVTERVLRKAACHVLAVRM